MNKPIKPRKDKFWSKAIIALIFGIFLTTSFVQYIPMWINFIIVIIAFYFVLSIGYDIVKEKLGGKNGN